MTELPDATFRAVYDRYFEHVARYCLRRLPYADAEDATAEVFLVVWRRIEEIPTDDTLPWLYGIARNVVRNARRSTTRALRLVHRIRAQPRYPGVGPEPALVRREEDQRLIDALSRLSSDDQEVLRLRAYEGLTIPQIARVLGCSEEAAKKRASRAMQRLRRLGSTDESSAGAFTRASDERGER